MDYINPAVIDGIRKNAKVFQAIIDIANELEKIGSLENAGREAETRLGALRGSEKNLSEELTKLREDIAKLSGDKAEHLERIEGLMAQAQRNAEAVVQDAKNLSADIIAKANKQADSMIGDALARAAAVDAKTQDAQVILDGINAEISAKMVERDSIQFALDELRKRIG